MNAHGTAKVVEMATAKVHNLIPGIPVNEQRGKVFAEKLIEFIDRNNGRYLRDEAGHYHVILGTERIPPNETPDNLGLAWLMHSACDISRVSPVARAALERLQVAAARRAGRMLFRKFSALSSDGARLYVPLEGGQVLQISANGISCSPNGDQDDLWVEHPDGAPFKLAPVDPIVGLGHFERLIVDTQACTVPPMRWFVAMNMGLFPFVRDSCPARFLLELIGSTQQGKTSGAQRFTLLHGLGQVKGDFSVAALSALGDIGLLVLDNKEQANFTQELTDYCLFLATGAERGRAQVDGQLRSSPPGRPVGAITTIGGVVKAELRARCVRVTYAHNGQTLPRGPIERDIRDQSDEILSALMLVLSRYFRIRDQRRATLNPIPEFEEHFTAVCDLLRAYAEVAGRPESWSENLINGWNSALLGAKDDDEEELEYPIERVLNERSNVWPIRITEEPVTVDGVAGRLYVTQTTDLLTELQNLKLRDLPLPRTPNGLSKRLNSCKFRSVRFLATNTPGVPALKRTSGRKPIGFFRPDDVVTS